MAKEPLPQFVAPMMASSVKEPFDSPDWIFETKIDGYRAIAVIDSTGKVRIWSRNRLPLEPKFPMVLDAINQLKLRSTILDGEIVALDAEGIPGFSCSNTTSGVFSNPISIEKGVGLKWFNHLSYVTSLKERFQIAARSGTRRSCWKKNESYVWI